MSPHILTLTALLAFSANSVICRLAMGDGTIDPASFTGIRLLAGAAVFAVIFLFRKGLSGGVRFSPLGALALFAYAIFFSFSYVKLSAGTGALILCATVQLTMMAVGVQRGERLGPLALVGSALALSGLVYLVIPQLSTPSMTSAVTMILCGVAWATYCFVGKGAKDPMVTTGWNFIGTVPLVVLSSFLFRADMDIQASGALLAVLSGALTSGLGYVIWYAALPHLSASKAGTLQLSVPVIAALAGGFVLAEPITLRLVASGLLVIGGIYLTMLKVTARPRAAS